MNRWWNSEKIVTQLRMRLLREEGTARLRLFLSDPEFTQILTEQLETAASQSSRESALQQVQQWLLQQQHQRRFQQEGQSLPAQRFWHFVVPLLESGSSSLNEIPHISPPIGEAFSTTPSSPKTPLFRSQPPTTPLRTPLPNPSFDRMSIPGSGAERSIPTVGVTPRTPLYKTTSPSEPSAKTWHHTGTPTPSPKAKHNTPLSKPKKGLPSSSSLPAVTAHETTPLPHTPSTSWFGGETPQSSDLSEYPGSSPPSTLPSESHGSTPLPEFSPAPRWDVAKILAQLRLTVLKDKSVGPLRGVLADVQFVQELQQTLHYACSLGSTDVAENHVHQWLLQQQHANHRQIPAQRLWNILQNVIEKDAMSTSQAEIRYIHVSQQTPLPSPTLRVETATPLPPAPPSLVISPPPSLTPLPTAAPSPLPSQGKTAQDPRNISGDTQDPQREPVMPRHKRSLRRHRSSSQWEAVPPDQESVSKVYPEPNPAFSQSDSLTVTPKKPSLESVSVSSPVPSKRQEENFLASRADEWTQRLDELIHHFPHLDANPSPQDQVTVVDTDGNTTEPFSPHTNTRSRDSYFSDLSRPSHLRLLSLLVVAVMVAGLGIYFHTAGQTKIEGISVDIAFLQKYLPVQTALRKKRTLSLVLAPTWQQKMTLADLERRILRLHQQFRQQNIERLNIFSRRQLLLTINLEVQF